MLPIPTVSDDPWNTPCFVICICLICLELFGTCVFFTEAKLVDSLFDNLRRCGYDRPTPAESLAITQCFAMFCETFCDQSISKLRYLRIETIPVTLSHAFNPLSETMA